VVSVGVSEVFIALLNTTVMVPGFGATEVAPSDGVLEETTGGPSVTAMLIVADPLPYEFVAVIV
jgi:hypothetical protein